MFEFTGKTNHKIKVVNVTEARGNFATILSDTKSHYIITKNSKPQRVIINFEDYKRLQELVQDEKQRHLQVESEFADENTEDAASKRAKPAKSLKGMIAAQFELSKKNENTESAPAEEPFSLEKVPSFTEADEPVAQETKVEAPVVDAEALLAPPEEQDYFTHNESEYEDLEKVLPDSEFMEIEDLPALSTESIEEEGEEKSIDETPPTRPETATEDQVEEEVELVRSPEEEDYFKRYRKLYEGFTEVVEPVVKVQNPWPQELQKVWEANPTAKTNVKISEMATVNAQEPSLTPASARNWEDSIMSPPITEEERQSYQEKPVEEKDFFGADEGLPSLQELLKDLEHERLSGEEGENLGSQDIDDLINRITSD